MSRPRVLLADDHQIVAEGLTGLLEPDFVVVDVVADGNEMVAAAKRHHPDLIVADIAMPILNGIEAALRLRDEGVSAKVVFLTMHREVAYARRALEAGAFGYVLKHSAASELVTALREVLRGQKYVSPMIAGELLESYRESALQPQDTVPGLTRRQREVLLLLAAGRSAKEVAANLKISPRTAEFHRARILEVLGIHSTVDLVKYAIRQGIISVELPRDVAQSAIPLS